MIFWRLIYKKAKLETKLALDSLRLLKSDLSIITKFKEQLVIFKSKNRLLTSTIDSLNDANLQLQKEKRFALKTISKKSDTITELESVNANLNKTIDNAAVLKASLVNAQSYKLKSGKKRYTSRARRAEAIDVCISLNENPLTKRGEKEIYIQIVDPNNNVVADKGEISFGETTLIYSQKKRILYKNENLEFCVPIVATIEDKPLLKGSYFINVFHENRKLGST